MISRPLRSSPPPWPSRRSWRPARRGSERSASSAPPRRRRPARTPRRGGPPRSAPAPGSGTVPGAARTCRFRWSLAVSCRSLVIDRPVPSDCPNRVVKRTSRRRATWHVTQVSTASGSVNEPVIIREALSRSDRCPSACRRYHRLIKERLPIGIESRIRHPRMSWSRFQGNSTAVTDRHRGLP